MTDKQELFCREYIIDLNATQAYIRAGYKARGHIAEVNACRMLRNAEVRNKISELNGDRMAKVKLSSEWVIERLIENIERSMQAVPVLDKEGNTIGEYQYNGAVANKALELLARHLGILNDRLTIEMNRLPDLTKYTPDDLSKLRELRDRIRGGRLQTLRGA